MAQLIKGLATKPNDLGLTLRAHSRRESTPVTYLLTFT